MTTTRFTDDHEWVRLEAEDIAVVGITKYAAEQLGDLVYVALPEVGQSVAQGEEAATVESVKTAAEVKSPVTGVVMEVNGTIADQPEKLGEDPAGAGWLYRIRLAAPAELGGLLGESAYLQLISEE